jgi:hypothetical protein
VKHRPAPLFTPDGRYIIVRGRLWRAANPNLPQAERQRLIDDLMQARRQVHTARKAGDEAAEKTARAAVDRAKRGLGERGPVWWQDGAPDLGRHMVRTTSYAQWYMALEDAQDPSGEQPDQTKR